MSTQAQPVRIFIAYSTHDLAFKEEIRKRLKPLLRAGKVTVWDNWDIEAGANWDNVIQENLHQADLILLLLSPDALDSDYFYEVEAPIALRRHKAGEAITVGVLLRPCALKHTPFEFEQYELLPKKGYPITDPRWANADEAYLTVFEEVDALVERVEDKKAGHSQDVTEVATRHEVKPPPVSDPNDPFSGLMIHIEGGSFDMGDTFGEGQQSELPVHSVTVPGFLLCKYPVTQGQWKQITDKNPSGFQGDDNLPVEQVNWDDVKVFIQSLNMLTNKAYRLPTEAEWEFAARGGILSKGFKFSGSDNLDEIGWASINSASKTHSVGKKKPNELGLYDMTGNVWEWVDDDWFGDYKGAPVDGSAWVNVNRYWPMHRVNRGGSWLNDPWYCRTAFRNGSGSNDSYASIGFRLAHSLPYK